MLQINGAQVLEIMPYGLCWKLQYSWENNKVILRHKGYALHLFGKIIPFPVTWLFGEGYAEETPINDHEFDMFTHISPPNLGQGIWL